MNNIINILIQKVPQTHKLIYLLFIGILPVIISLSIVLFHHKTLNDKASLIKASKKAFFYTLDQRSRRHQFLQKYLGADPSYLHQHISQFPLNASYLAKLRTALNTLPFSTDRAMQKKYHRLSEQSLLFQKKPVYQSHLLNEFIFSLENPILLTSSSLQKIFAIIEGTTIGNFGPMPKRPQIFFTDVKIKKQTQGLYQCQMELFQREFYKKNAS